MAIEVLRTKVTLPSRRRELLSRRRLNDLWDELIDNKLILLTASAGYGKTSYLIDIAQYNSLPFCWYSLNELDQDLQRFLAYFTACIDQRFPEFKESSMTIMRVASQSGASAVELARLCAGEVYRKIREHFVIVLDDFHLVDMSQPVNVFVNRFIQDADENCHLVITSRSLIPLDDLSLMVARSQVGGLGFSELAFRADEIQALMQQNYNQVIPSSMADDLVFETEGWITGLLLSAQNMWQGMTDRIRTTNVSGIGLNDYLLQQVLDQQDPELREVLLRTSIFEEFDASLCETVLGPPPGGTDWQTILDRILQNNLFVVPIGEERAFLRYHHLFQDFLQNQFAIEQPEEKILLLRGLAAVHTLRRDWDRAYAIYQRLNDVEAIADLLEGAGESLVRNGQLARLAQWIDSLPLVILISRPALLARRGVAACALGEPQRGLSMLDQSVATFRTARDCRQLARTLVWRAWALFNQSNHSASLADADEALTLTQPDCGSNEFRAEALRIRGLNLRMMGDLGRAIPSLREALGLYDKHNDIPSVTRVSLALGATYLDKGEFGSALSCYNSACSYFRKEKDYFSLANALNDLAFLHHLSGDYRRAAHIYEEAVSQARQSKNIHIEVMILSGLGDLFVDLDAFQAAQEFYRNAREIAHRLNHHYMVFYLYLAEAALERMKGEMEQAHELLEVAESLVGSLESQYTLALYRLEAGRLALAEKDLSRAARSILEAANMFISGGQGIDASRAYLALAITNFEAGDLDEAVSNLEESFRLVSGLESQHILVPAARQARDLLESVSGMATIRVQSRRLKEQVDLFERNIPSLRRSLRKKKSAVILTPPRLRIQTLGKTRVYLDKKLISSADWQAQVTRDLFFLFLSDTKGWTKEELGAALWPDSTPGQLKIRFKNTMYRLRRALGQDAIIFNKDQYSFDWSMDYEYDVEDFWEALRRFRETNDPNEKKSALNEAVQLYQGDFLPDVDGTWVVEERERLRQAFVEVRLELAKLLLEFNETDQALIICKDLIAENPSLETAHQLAMQVHAAVGDKNAITEQYIYLKQVLTEELDTSPSSLTQSLYRSLTN
jgi:LuxR family maltose regulon positive regulatory protein